MNNKTLLTPFLVLLGLITATVSAFFLGGLFPEIEQVPALEMPPLSPLDLPLQTVNGFTAQIESYYADASRLVFVVRINSETSDFSLDSASIRTLEGTEINAGYGVSPYLIPSTYMIDFVTAQSLPEDHLDGQLAFRVTKPGDWTPLADFRFDLDIPVHPDIILEPKQTVWANGLEMLLDRVVITPSYTNAYLCYVQPRDGDWMIGQETTLGIDDAWPVRFGTYSLLFDKALGDGTKGGEPGWTPPVQNGRCVKVGFPVGSARPKRLILTIPALEQSTPEVIPEEEIVDAQERLKAEGIEMEWHTVDHGAYPEYKKLPAGMSEAEAYQRFIRALGYVYSGTWTFEVLLASGQSR